MKRLASILLLALLPLAATAQIRDGLAVQAGREDKLKKRGAREYYSERWDLSDLPAYVPQQKVSGTIRQVGSNYFEDGNLNALWEEGFKQHHPDIVFEKDLRTALAAIPALTFGSADLAPSRMIFTRLAVYAYNL